MRVSLRLVVAVAMVLSWNNPAAAWNLQDEGFLWEFGVRRSAEFRRWGNKHPLGR